MQIVQFRWTPEAGWGALPPSASSANLVLAFSGAEYFRTPQCYQELRKMFPGAHILGRSSSGSIQDAHIGDDDVVATAVTFQAGSVKLVSCASCPANACRSLPWTDAGTRGSRACAMPSFFLTGSRSTAAILAKGFSSAGISVTGGLAGDAARFASTWVMADAPAAQNVVATIGFYGEILTARCGCVAGWREFGAERLVTRSEGNVVYEIDYKPALEIYTKYLGDMAKDLPGSGLRFPLSVRQTELDEPVISTFLAVDAKAQSLTFAGDVPQGSFCRLMKTDVDSLIDGSGIAAEAEKSAANDNPSLCLVVSCVGRRLVMGQLTEEELDIVRERLGPAPTITGF